MAKRFLGLWKLIPQACKYDIGQAPLKATYSFVPHVSDPNPADPKKINVKIEWTDISKQDMSTAYEINLNGKKQLEEHFGMKMQVLHEVTPEGRLKSTTFTEDGSIAVMEACR